MHVCMCKYSLLCQFYSLVYIVSEMNTLYNQFGGSFLREVNSSSFMSYYWPEYSSLSRGRTLCLFIDIVIVRVVINQPFQGDGILYRLLVERSSLSKGGTLSPFTHIVIVRVVFNQFKEMGFYTDLLYFLNFAILSSLLVPKLHMQKLYWRSIH